MATLPIEPPKTQNESISIDFTHIETSSEPNSQYNCNTFASNVFQFVPIDEESMFSNCRVYI